MRKIYLIRHALPDFPGGEKMCLGTTDIPLGTLGRLQSCVMGYGMRDMVSGVFSSGLSRAYETALFISPDTVKIEGLREMYAGEWDGRSFSQIKAGWPELFAIRADRYFPPPGAEETDDALTRFLSALRECLAGSEGDIAIVSHNSMIQVFLTSLLPHEPPRYRIRMPYVSYTVVTYDGLFHTDGVTHIPHSALTEGLCRELMDAAGAADRVKKHCQAAAERALSICDELNARGMSLDRELIYRSALLHDIARTEKDHPAVGAGWLSSLGYTREAEIISQHHDTDLAALNEAAVVHIADKLVIEDRAVTLEERFSGSMAKCPSPEAVAAHDRHYAAALSIQKAINAVCGKRLIP